MLELISLLHSLQKLIWLLKEKYKVRWNRLILFYIVSFFHDQMNYNGMVVGIFRRLTQTILLPPAADQNKFLVISPMV